ncbi:MAG: hypothetical protein MUF00_14430 [Gemmatimonadaceae bacterium]|jgi:hypothetical protein|nr:hypothetical protein [Gemmatimonadaceae bacterium]
MRAATRALLVCTALATVGVLLWAADYSRPSLYAVLALMLGWAALPYALLWGTLSRRPEHAVRTRVVAALAVASAAVAGWFIGAGFIGSSDGQAALVFLFLPVYQLMAIGAVLLPTEWWIRRRG